MVKKRKYIDLFSGCGGLSLGFFNSKKRQGKFAIEKDSMSFETLDFNLKKHFDRPENLDRKPYDINAFLEEKKEFLRQFENTDLITGGPPCQGFSLAGKRDPSDKRNSLVDSYLLFVGIVQPKIVFLENVTGFTSQKKGDITYEKYVTNELEKKGYTVESQILDFSLFGVPQKRKRFILVATKGKNRFFEKLESYRKDFLDKKGLSENVSVSDALGDLVKSNGIHKSLDTNGFSAGEYGSIQNVYQKLMRENCNLQYPDSHRFTNHSDIITSRFAYSIKHKLSPKELKEHFGLKKNNTKVLESKKSAPTLTTLPDDYIHYSEPRILTVREYARIQSFNDWYQFKGKYTTGGKLRVQETPRYTQIGNAIPPLFAECAADVLYDMINE